ncbi:unnamed protein product [Enterobius vermicularis]|uniref:FIP-RBD domain-containing protein n=1 Tax=Enterobius vermicularis TaxID=51028 RepID=A0A0N4VQM1_ENTVE|nr:unnamed protein product [Enterobius vermicularis]
MPQVSWNRTTWLLQIRRFYSIVVVLVLAARGLILKGHSKLDAFVNLSLTDGSSWKSKVQTDNRKTTTGNCIWNQRCEFSVNSLDSVLTVTVYHRTIIGKTESVGVVQMPLRPQFGKRESLWFLLRKKSTLSSNADKYRGEIQLKFEFSNKFSTSSLTLNSVHGGSKLESLKRKMRFGKKKDKFLDAASVAGFPGYSDRSSLTSLDLSRNLSQLSFGSDGLIIPPSQSFPAYGTVQLASPLGDSASSCSRRASTSSLHPSRGSSPVVASEVDEVSAVTTTLAQSTTSSGFSSTRSSKIRRPTVMTYCEQGVCCEELRKTVEEQRLQLAFKDAKIRDLQEYIDKLVTRVMENDPALLECSRVTYAH